MALAPAPRLLIKLGQADVRRLGEQFSRTIPALQFFHSPDSFLGGNHYGRVAILSASRGRAAVAIEYLRSASGLQLDKKRFLGVAELCFQPLDFLLQDDVSP